MICSHSPSPLGPKSFKFALPLDRQPHFLKSGFCTLPAEKGALNPDSFCILYSHGLLLDDLAKIV
jgi:hypothetical protein